MIAARQVGEPGAAAGEQLLAQCPRAVLALHEAPLAKEPAWNRTGVRCGDGSARCGPATRYRGPSG